MLSARAVEATLRDRNVTVGMRAVLEVLDTSDPATVPQIAATLGLKRQGVQRLVDELIVAGYVESRANPRHRRSRLIVLTDAGRDAFAAIRREENSHLAQMAQDCSDEEIATAARVLSSLHGDVRRRVRNLASGEEDVG